MSLRYAGLQSLGTYSNSRRKARLRKHHQELELEGSNLPNQGESESLKTSRQCFKKPVAAGLRGFKPHPPHHYVEKHSESVRC